MTRLQGLVFRLMTRTLFLFLMAAAGRSQSTSGGILGDVTDPSGSAVPGAAVTVSNILTGNERIVISDGAGHYAMTNLPTASYVISVEFGEPHSPAYPEIMGIRTTARVVLTSNKTTLRKLSSRCVVASVISINAVLF